MKAFFLLLLLLPLCTAQYNIECYGKDYLMVDNMLQCSGRVRQVCYTRDTGERGCTRLEFCSNEGWKCCFTDRCNV
uniref:Uncharacterized protein n=1 Tax=Myripristis murdjan TaxID=586833 RepID=A0A667XKU9_9TELE